MELFLSLPFYIRSRQLVVLPSARAKSATDFRPLATLDRDIRTSWTCRAKRDKCVDPEGIRHFRRTGSWRRGLKWAVCPIQRLWQTLVGLFSQMVALWVHSGGCLCPLSDPPIFWSKICVFMPKFHHFLTKIQKIKNLL